MATYPCSKDQLAQTVPFSVISIRFALRLSLISKEMCAEVLQGDDDLFQFFGAAVAWPTESVDEIWDIHSKALKGQVDESKGRDAISLRDGLVAGDKKLWQALSEYVAKTWAADADFVMRLLADSLRAIAACHGAEPGQHSGVTVVAEIYALTALETRILEYAHASFQRPSFKKFLRCIPLAAIDSAWKLLAAMVEYSETDVRQALAVNGKLCANGLIRLEQIPDQLSDFVTLGPVAIDLLLKAPNTPEGLKHEVLHPLKAPQLGIEDFPHCATEIHWIVQCLQAAARDRVPGVNVLIHGPTGSGKTELAKLLVQTTGLQGFEIQSDMRSMDSSLEVGDWLTQLKRTRQMLALSSNSVLVFKGVCDAAKHCAAELVDHLDATISPTIWIGDGGDTLSDAVLRRFAFHLDMRQTPLSARKQIAAKLMRDLPVASSTLDGVSGDPGISPAQITMAVRFAELCRGDAPKARGDILVAALEASQRIKGAPLFSQANAANARNWDLDALNLESSAPMPRILDALRRTGSASLAFHGIPGTGKTSLANHIAQTLGKQLICKRVSDLSSRWIGGTERAIANMFHEASTEDAVLLLDEADSFLRDRRFAKTSWEVTQVNEMLQQMESFKGIFICATNLIDDVDAAALRRFTFKIRFLPLDDQRRRRMLARYALLDANADLPRPICDRLNALSELAPGDFATVHRQEVMIDERFSLEAWMTELEREHAMRVPGFKKRAAFV